MEKQAIGFHLVAIKTEQFAVFEEHFSDKKKLELSSNFQFRIDTETKRMGVFATFQFESGKNTFIKLEVSCHFDIEEDAWASFMLENEIRVPVGFARHLSMLTIGTARGILHCKTEGTSFNAFPLPTINVAQIVKEDVVFGTHKF